MTKFFVKLFSASSPYTWVDAESPLEAAEKHAARRLKVEGDGPPIAVVQVKSDGRTTAVGFYADNGIRPTPSYNDDAVLTLCANGCRAERENLLKDIADLRSGELRVQSTTGEGWADVTAMRLDMLRLRLASLDSILAVVGAAPGG